MPSFTHREGWAWRNYPISSKWNFILPIRLILKDGEDVSAPGVSPKIYDELVIEDVRNAADVLRPVYDATGGADGFVIIEPPRNSHRYRGND